MGTCISLSLSLSIYLSRFSHSLRVAFCVHVLRYTCANTKYHTCHLRIQGKQLASSGSVCVCVCVCVCVYVCLWACVCVHVSRFLFTYSMTRGDLYHTCRLHIKGKQFNMISEFWKCVCVCVCMCVCARARVRMFLVFSLLWCLVSQCSCLRVCVLVTVTVTQCFSLSLSLFIFSLWMCTCMSLSLSLSLYLVLTLTPSVTLSQCVDVYMAMCAVRVIR